MDYDNIQRKFAGITLDKNYTDCDDVDDLYNDLFRKAGKTIKDNRVVIESNHGIRENFSDIWITVEISGLIKKKQELFDKIKKHCWDQIIGIEYRKIRSEATNKIRESKSKYYMTGFTNNGNNQREQWKIVNEIIGKDLNKIKKLPRGNVDLALANSFNGFFRVWVLTR